MNYCFRNIEELKKWRRTHKLKPQKSYDPKKMIPFDIDEENYDNFPSRDDIQNKVIITKKSKRIHSKAKLPDVERLISDMINSLHNMSVERNTERSPRSQMEKAGRDIKKVRNDKLHSLR